jgi:hypothetical protein
MTDRSSSWKSKRTRVGMVSGRRRERDRRRSLGRVNEPSNQLRRRTDCVSDDGREEAHHRLPEVKRQCDDCGKIETGTNTASDINELNSPAMRDAAATRPSINKLEFRIHSVHCVDDTSEWGADEIAIGGTGVDASGDTTKIPLCSTSAPSRTVRRRLMRLPAASPTLASPTRHTAAGHPFVDFSLPGPRDRQSRSRRDLHGIRRKVPSSIRLALVRLRLRRPHGHLAAKTARRSAGSTSARVNDIPRAWREQAPPTRV